MILEVVGRRLGVPVGRAGAPPPSGTAKSKGKLAPARPRATRKTSPERQELLASIERIVRAGTGVSASDVARAIRLPQSRVAAGLKELKLTGRIHQGGDRRFARYAGDAKVAEEASRSARETAPGPIVARKPARKSARAKK